MGWPAGKLKKVSKLSSLREGAERSGAHSLKLYIAYRRAKTPSFCVEFNFLSNGPGFRSIRSILTEIWPKNGKYPPPSDLCRRIATTAVKGLIVNWFEKVKTIFWARLTSGNRNIAEKKIFSVNFVSNTNPLGAEIFLKTVLFFTSTEVQLFVCRLLHDRDP